MKLEQLYPNFADLPERDQLAFVRNYRNKRFMDLQSYNISATTKKTTKKRTSKRKVKPPMDNSKLEALKKLGLSASQINKMRK